MQEINGQNIVWLETNGIQAVFNLIQRKEHQRSKRLYYPKGADQKTSKKPFSY
jgi:hypothetical protein